MKRNHILGGLLILLISCGGIQINSKWAETPISIDARISDWEGELFFNKEEKSAIGIKNDSNYIYLCLTTRDKEKAFSAIRRGLTVWFEPKSGKTLGIKYPLFDLDQIREHNMASEMSTARSKEKKFNFKLFEEQHFEFTVIDNDEYPLYKFNISDTSAYKVKMNFDNDQFIYELRIPLSFKQYKLKGLTSQPGEEVTVHIETNEMERPHFEGMEKPNVSMGDEISGTRGSRGGMRGSGKRPGADRMRQKGSLEELEIKLNVLLADKH